MDPKELKPDEHQLQQVEQQIQEDNPEDDVKVNEGAWTLQENKKYIFFMVYFKDIFVSKERRKSFKIFKFLSSLLQTRNARQCRSHFQKLINKHKTIHKLKNYFKTQVGKEAFDEQYKQFSTMMDSNHPLSKIKKKQQEEGSKELNQIGVQTQTLLQTYFHENNWGSSSNLDDFAPQPMPSMYGILIFPTQQQPIQPINKQQ